MTTMCDKHTYCDGFPEQCLECPNMKTTKDTPIVNNINIELSGGSVVSIVALIVGMTLWTHSINNGTGKVHNPAGAILPDRYTVYDITEMGKEA